MVIATQRSLEDFRNHKFLTMSEFVAELGITEQTYRRILRKDPKVQNTTKRSIARCLAVAPHMIAEFVPSPSDAYLAALSLAIEEGNTNGWYAYDPDSSTLSADPTEFVVPPGDDA